MSRTPENPAPGSADARHHADRRRQNSKPKRKRTIEIALIAGLVLLIGAGAAVASTLSRGRSPPRRRPSAYRPRRGAQARLLRQHHARAGPGRRQQGPHRQGTRRDQAQHAGLQRRPGRDRGPQRRRDRRHLHRAQPGDQLLHQVATASRSTSSPARRPAARSWWSSPGINSAADLKGKTLASPQLGDTQDVALRAWLGKQGYKTDTDGSGDVHINPTENAQTLKLFQQGELDGAWLPEPWVSRLVLQAGANVLVDETDLWEEARSSPPSCSSARSSCRAPRDGARRCSRATLHPSTGSTGTRRRRRPR